MSKKGRGLMEKAVNGSDGPAAERTPRWDATGMSSAYCNVASATTRRDSIALNLGISQRDGAPEEQKVELLHRIVLSPRTASHLHQILGTLLAEYETQRGGKA
jgi:hypothetical protein